LVLKKAAVAVGRVGAGADSLILRYRGARAGGITAALALGLLGGPEPASAFSPTPLGSEFQVNTYTTINQYAVRVASDAAGDFVVVWESYGTSAGNDTSKFSIQGRRYNATGSPLGAQFQVNTYTTDNQIVPSIASDPNGNFVVVWINDTSSMSVEGQRYDASGAAIGGEFQVNTYTPIALQEPAVASDSVGNFVVAWTGGGILGNGIQGQRFASTGAPICSQFLVNTYTTGGGEYPSIASDPNGNFVVVWNSYGSPGTDHSSYSVQGRRFDASGNGIGAQFQVNTYTTQAQSIPSVAIDSKGDFVVAWQSNGSPGTDTSGFSIQGQRYDASGSPKGGEFQVNTYTTGNQFIGNVANDSYGDFVVTWVNVGSPQTVQARTYDATGAPASAQFQVNSYTASTIGGSVASGSMDKGFVVAFGEVDYVGASAYDNIKGQRYLPEPSFVQSLGAMLAALLALDRRRRHVGAECPSKPAAAN